MEDSELKQLVSIVPSILAGKGWTSESAEEYIMITLRLTRIEAREILQRALALYPNRLKNINIIYRALE